MTDKKSPTRAPKPPPAPAPTRAPTGDRHYVRDGYRIEPIHKAPVTPPPPKRKT